MDINIDRNFEKSGNYFENYAHDKLVKFFSKYPFVESIKVFFRGKKHPTKKVKIQARFKGKDIFVEATGEKHDLALNQAAIKLNAQAKKYKTKFYRKAS